MLNHLSLEMIKGSKIRIDLELYNQSETITMNSHSIMSIVEREQDLKMFQDDRDALRLAFEVRFLC